MPLRGAAFHDLIRPYYEHALAGRTDLEWFDAHTHVGHNDPDGLEADPPDLLEAMDAAGHRRALLFPLHEPDGYGAANDRVLAASRDFDGRFSILGRVDPKVPGALAEAERCLDAGAAGIKLHPRSDAFTLPHPVVDEIVAAVAERGGIVLFHAGRGIPNLGHQAIDLANANPDVNIILAHAGVSDLGLISTRVADVPNLYFDSAWWQMGDMMALFTQVPPGRILWATDMPYGTPMVAGLSVLRICAALGIAEEAVRSIVGGQLARLVAGEAPLDVGPPADIEALGPRVLSAERALAYITGTFMAVVSGGRATEALAMARLSCQSPGPEDPHHELLGHIDRLLARSQEITLELPDEPRAALIPSILAQIVAGTPHVPLPAVD
jgi:predicted TIM-barrel fold metal-dependent hydrolase